MKYLFFFFCLLSFQKTLAQTQENQIQQVIVQIFDGMRQSDTTKIKNVLHESCFLKSIGKNKAGETYLQEDAIQSWLKQIGTPHPGVIYDEKLLSFDIKIDGNMAVAWVPYQFYVNEKLNHCGVDVFTLMQVKNQWKVVAIMDTRRKEKCL